MKIEGACHPVISVCPFKSHIIIAVIASQTKQLYFTIKTDCQWKVTKLHGYMETPPTTKCIVLSERYCIGIVGYILEYQSFSPFTV